jgi:hypothetical protein
MFTMKILFVVYGSIAQISGGYLYDRKVLSALKDKNCFIEVLEIRKWPYIIAPLQSFFTPIRSLFKYTGGGLKDNYDLVIIDELTHPSLFLALVLRKHSRRKVAVLVHHLKSKEAIGFPWRAVSRLFEKTLLKNADLIIVNSTTTARTVTDLQKMPIPVHICTPGRHTFSVWQI